MLFPKHGHLPDFPWLAGSPREGKRKESLPANRTFMVDHFWGGHIGRSLLDSSYQETSLLLAEFISIISELCSMLDFSS
jgi:hypothetical protein